MFGLVTVVVAIGVGVTVAFLRRKGATDDEMPTSGTVKQVRQPLIQRRPVSERPKRSVPPPPPKKPEPDIDTLRQRLVDLAKPAAFARPDGDGDIAATGSRLGGPVWLPSDMQAPVDRAGRRLLFLAQVDFADLPDILGFPGEGVLQFFLGTDVFFGANFDDLLSGEYAVLHHPDPAKLTTRHEATAWDAGDAESYSPFMTREAQEVGVPLRFGPSTLHRPDAYATPANFHELPDFEWTSAMDELMDEGEKPGDGSVAHVGGHPRFTQDDPRLGEGNPLQPFDSVLLQLGYSEHVMIGDMGEMSFMIRSGDLARGDFSKIIYTWDCS